LPGGTEESHETHNSWETLSRMKFGPAARVPTTQPRGSVGPMHIDTSAVTSLAVRTKLKRSIIFWDMTPCRTTRRYIPEDYTLHNHRCENLEFYIVLNFIGIRMGPGVSYLKRGRHGQTVFPHAFISYTTTWVYLWTERVNRLQNFVMKLQQQEMKMDLLNYHWINIAICRVLCKCVDSSLTSGAEHCILAQTENDNDYVSEKY
jgi:hypothetical protein